MTVAIHIAFGVLIGGLVLTGLWLLTTWYWPTLRERLEERRIARGIWRQKADLRKAMGRDKR